MKITIYNNFYKDLYTNTKIIQLSFPFHFHLFLCSLSCLWYNANSCSKDDSYEPSFDVLGALAQK